MLDLTNKKVLLICPYFYGYDRVIADTLRKRGASVETVYENLEWVSVRYRLMYYFHRKDRQMEERYYKKRMIRRLSAADYCFVIRGSSLPPSIMKAAREAAPYTGICPC